MLNKFILYFLIMSLPLIFSFLISFFKKIYNLIKNKLYIYFFLSGVVVFILAMLINDTATKIYILFFYFVMCYLYSYKDNGILYIDENHYHNYIASMTKIFFLMVSLILYLYLLSFVNIISNYNILKFEIQKNDVYCVYYCISIIIIYPIFYLIIFSIKKILQIINFKNCEKVFNLMHQIIYVSYIMVLIIYVCFFIFVKLGFTGDNFIHSMFNNQFKYSTIDRINNCDAMMSFLNLLLVLYGFKNEILKIFYDNGNNVKNSKNIKKLTKNKKNIKK